MWLNHRVMLGFLSSQKGRTWLKLSSHGRMETRADGKTIWVWGAFPECLCICRVCFGAVFNTIFHIFFIAVGAFGHLYSQEDTENPSKLSLMHLSHVDYSFRWGGDYLLIVTVTFLQSKFDNWLCKLLYISLFFSLFYWLKRTHS